MPQRGELAQAQRLPRGTLLAQGPGGAGDYDVPCAVGQYGLTVLLYPPPCATPFGARKVSCTGGTLQNELAHVGETQMKNLD